MFCFCCVFRALVAGYLECRVLDNWVSSEERAGREEKQEGTCKKV